MYCIINIFQQLTWVTHRIGEHLKLEFGAEDIGVSYLPLSHVAAQVNDIYVPLVLGMSVFFAQPDALKVCRLHMGMY